MNDFTVKKTAEAVAFMQICHEVVKRAGQSFTDNFPELNDVLTNYPYESISDCIADDKRQLYEGKLSRTIAKLQQISQLYVGDEWNDPAEVLEVLSLLLGGTVGHCAVSRPSEAAVGANILLREHLDVAQLHYQSAIDTLIDVAHRVSPSEN